MQYICLAASPRLIGIRRKWKGRRALKTVPTEAIRGRFVEDYPASWKEGM